MAVKAVPTWAWSGAFLFLAARLEELFSRWMACSKGPCSQLPSPGAGRDPLWDTSRIFLWLCNCQEMDWDQLDVNPRVIVAIKKANLKSVREIFNLSQADLQRVTKLSTADVQYLLRTLSSAVRKHPVLTALQLFQDKNQHKKLSLGCPVLDGFLKGGIPLTGITEIAGESSAGKTQIALQLTLSVQYPYKYGGLESGAVYICTEDAFPNKRLQQLIQQQANLRDDVPPNVVEKIKFGNGIFVEHAADLDAFLNCITKRICILLSRGMVRLVIVDSIAALFRCEFGAKDSVLKAKYLQMFGAKLHQLSSKFQIPVVCINQGYHIEDGTGLFPTAPETKTRSNGLKLKEKRFHLNISKSFLTGKPTQQWSTLLQRVVESPPLEVTDTMDASGDAAPSPGCIAQRVAPALGITWSNQLLMRLMASRTIQSADDVHHHSRGVLRTLGVVFAPHLPQTFCHYTVNLEGVRGIKEETLTAV